ncbi:MAG: AMP-binding protein [Rhizomicrobium sp.]
MPIQDVTGLSIGAALALQAARRPNSIAICSEGRGVSWEMLHRRTNRLARALEARGLRHGDFLTIALPNGIAFVEACYAAWKVGAIPQPVSFRLPKAELNAIIELANTPFVIGESQMDAERPCYTVEALGASCDDDGDLADRVSPAWKAPTSGGSTGRPKLIVAGQPGLASPLMAEFWRIAPHDTVLIPGPLYHNGPFICTFSALQIGASVVIMPKFDAQTTLRAISEHRASWIYLVPTMMSRISCLPDETRAQFDVSSLKTVWHLAAPCPPWLKEEWISWLGADVIMELYGGTEGQARTVITGTEWLGHRGSVGRVYPGGEMKAVDSEGRELPTGEVGEIYMRRAEGVELTYRYIGAEARTLPGGWESLGDIGWFDEDGYLYLADRRSDMILVGGANVYPAEVEAAIDEHPLVQSSAVIGLPDDDLGNRIHAIVQTRGEIPEDVLASHLAERLVTYKRPRSFEFVDEPLRDDAGKVRRSALRAERIAQAKGHTDKSAIGG